MILHTTYIYAVDCLLISLKNCIFSFRHADNQRVAEAYLTNIKNLPIPIHRMRKNDWECLPRKKYDAEKNLARDTAERKAIRAKATKKKNVSLGPY